MLRAGLLNVPKVASLSASNSRISSAAGDLVESTFSILLNNAVSC
jgi:hypothetical protein